MEIWIGFTLFAAVMQAIRTAGQKRIATHISPMATTLVRYIFGLPIAIIYLCGISTEQQLLQLSHTIANASFLFYACAAAVAQIFATVCLVKVLGFRNFAIGTSFAKTEAIQTAILGSVFFSAHLSGYGWLAVLLGVLGILVISLPNKTHKIETATVFYGISSGIAFALTSLWIRQASLSLGDSFMFNAAVTLLFMVGVQSLLCYIYIQQQQQEQFSIIKRHLTLALFVGASSALGSIGWFTAMTYHNAAIVKSLGQIEIVFTLLITYFYFKERISPKEYLGMALIMASVIILVLLN